MSALTDSIAEVLRKHGDVYRSGRYECVCDEWDGGMLLTDYDRHVAEQIAAALTEAAFVANVQAAIVNAMNAVGAALIGSSWELVEASPVPDDEVASLVSAARSEVGS